MLKLLPNNPEHLQCLQPSSTGNDVNPPPYELFQGGRCRQGQPSLKNQDFFGSDPKLLPVPHDFEFFFEYPFIF